MDDSLAVLIDGLLPFEIQGYCQRLEEGGIFFKVGPYSNPAAAQIMSTSNAFSNGGLGISYRILVEQSDFDKAVSLLEIDTE